MSQYVVSDESSSLTHHGLYSSFVCFLCGISDKLGNFHADQMFRTIPKAKGEGLDPVN